MTTYGENTKYFKNLKIGNIQFDNPFLNASGCWCANEEQIYELIQSKLGGVVSKTCSIFSQEGNKEPNYYYEPNNNVHFNCKGLPNNGYDYYKKISKNIENKPFILSIAYTNIYEIILILNDYDKYLDKSALVEINLSCPNIETRIPGYHLDDIEVLLVNIKELDYDNVCIGLKLPPYFELEFMDKLSNLLNKYESIIHFIVASNSIPNGLVLDDKKKPILSNVYGGISGKLNKMIALSNIKTFYSLLNESISIIGCGGINDYDDVLDYLKYGAKFVQLASCFYQSETNKLDLERINNLVNKLKNPKNFNEQLKMDNSETSLIINTKHFHFVVNKLREFFIAKGFLECHTQNRLSILAACEDPSTIRTFNYNNKVYPLPQTGQMWLEYELLKNPEVSGYFCVSTSYRYEPNPIPGRHALIFPMFEFELKGGMDELEKMEKELLQHLGYHNVCQFKEGDYEDVASKYNTTDVSHEVEQKLYKDEGPVFFLKNFPEYTSPFWNMRRNEAKCTANKIDVILSGMETIGSAERSCDVEDMMNRFKTISNGEYAQILYDKFGKYRVDCEMNDFLANNFMVRSGGGIGITRLISSMLKEGLIPE
jgi:dihydroorotate dehydrogenase